MDLTRLNEPPGFALGRRDFLRGAALAVLPFTFSPAGAWHALTRDDDPSGIGLIPRQKDPENLEGPFQALDSFVTPTPRFYVRNHFAMPRLDAKTWRLRIEGLVKRPLELTYDDLRQMPARTQLATLECAGNARSFLTPKPKGVPWQLGAVGTAEWTGVTLAAVLERAGLGSAVEVLLQGADSGPIKDDPKPQGAVPFARSLPLTKALAPETLLAYKMNGAELSPAHGYPLRAIVPGWYGVASIKWLTRVVVLDKPFGGFFQTIDYTYWRTEAGLPMLTPITDLQVKAAVARPAPQETLPGGQPFRVHGAAWGSDAAVTRVQVSTDGGKSWAEAKLLDPPQPFCWRRWEHRWQTPAAPGAYTVLARATDGRGRVQALERDPDRRNYMITHVLPITVTVR